MLNVEYFETRHTTVDQLYHLTRRIFQRIGKTLDEHIASGDEEAFKAYLDDVKLLVEDLFEWSLDDAQGSGDISLEAEALLRDLTIFQGYLGSVKGDRGGDVL